MEMNQKKSLDIFDYTTLINESQSLRHGADLKIYKIKEPKKLLRIYKKAKYRYEVEKDFNPLLKNIHLLNLAIADATEDEKRNIVLYFDELTKIDQESMDQIIEELFNLYDYFRNFQHIYIARFIKTLLLQIENTQNPYHLIQKLKTWSEYHLDIISRGYENE